MTCFFDFLWDGKPDKIKREIAKLKLEQGGLGMIDIVLFDKALKLTWIRRLLTCSSKWKELICLLYPKLENIQFFGDQFIKGLGMEIKNTFWNNILTFLYEFHSKFQIMTFEDLSASCFQYNKNFKVGGSVISNGILIENNIFFIHQLMEEKVLMNYEQFTQKYNIQLNYLTFYSIIRCIEKSIDFNTLEETGRTLKNQQTLSVILKSKKGSSDIYNIFLNYSNKSKGKNKWKTLLGLEEDDWAGSFPFLKYTVKDTKLRWLQFRILHHTLTTNRSVAKFKENQTELCTFCNERSETIQHLFWHCSFVREFWEKLRNTISTKCIHAERLVFNEKLILFGQDDFLYTDTVCNLIILMAKLYIYRCKVQNSILDLKTFMRELYLRYCQEKIIIKDKTKFKNKWEPYSVLFKSLL